MVSYPPTNALKCLILYPEITDLATGEALRFDSDVPLGQALLLLCEGFELRALDHV
jgi:hypothetical protein